ncbi:unnamed protein product [Paramecium pentaurelia]|uniref:Uncharacterized protein n=1 Tax=Paramecium pentaurelia TaxID=43138 RepID=A0A8S1VSK8_9CILI|nr:unnamed protein product [Paramecium pentaurelia]
MKVELFLITFIKIYTQLVVYEENPTSIQNSWMSNNDTLYIDCTYGFETVKVKTCLNDKAEISKRFTLPLHSQVNIEIVAQFGECVSQLNLQLDDSIQNIPLVSSTSVNSLNFQFVHNNPATFISIWINQNNSMSCSTSNQFEWGVNLIKISVFDCHNKYHYCDNSYIQLPWKIVYQSNDFINQSISNKNIFYSYSQICLSGLIFPFYSSYQNLSLQTDISSQILLKNGKTKVQFKLVLSRLNFKTISIFLNSDQINVDIDKYYQYWCCLQYYDIYDQSKYHYIYNIEIDTILTNSLILNIQIQGNYQVYLSIIDFIIYQLQQNVDELNLSPGCSNFIDGLCYNCIEGWNYLDQIKQCLPICGDKIIQGNEECDDGNLIPNDGCYNCKYSCVKNCFICEFGKCIQCLIGYKLKSQHCQPICGDGLTLDSEQCDDGNNDKFDGCYKCQYSCQIECKLCVNQKCFQCLDGWQLIKNKCQQVCNDNHLAIISIEQCDNVDDIYCNDCVQLCQDNCILCLKFNQCQICRHPFQLVNEICTSICGDQIVTNDEQCDDGNDIQFDGCYECQLQCSFGCKSCQNNNICTKCDPQFTKLNNNTVKCEQIENEILTIQEEIIEDSYNQCGNGLFNSLYEDCDDGNISGGDGCSAYCNIEASFICINVEGLLSICTYIETPKFQLQQLSNKNSQQQIIELGFTQKVKQNTGIPFENITIFTVSPPTKYDINIIPLVKCSTEFNQSKYQISIFFKDPVQNPFLKVEIEKSIIINELNQGLTEYKQEISLGQPFVISQATQQTVTKIVAMNDAIIYSMISISGLVLLTGNTIIFFNLLDLLQSLSYLRYLQYQFPQHLKQFLDTYTKISLKPILDFLQIDVFLSTLNGGTLPFQKKAQKQNIQNELNTYFLMNSKSCYLSILISLVSYCMFCLITSSKMVYWIKKLEERLWKNSKYLNICSLIQKNIIQKCLRLKIQYFQQGIFQMYYSILHQLLFSALLQFPDYTFKSAFDIFNSINAITVLLFILLSTIQLLSITATKINDKRKWKYFYTDYIDRFWAKNYKSFQIYRVILYIFIIVAFIDFPELQSILLSMLSIIYLIYLISNKPVRSKYDFIKLILKETFLMIITGSFLIYSLQLTNEQLLLFGWMHIALFSSMLASSLIIDMINHFIKAYEHYQRLKQQNEIKQIQSYFNNRLQQFILHDPEKQQIN